jgi:hypothetical protein
VNNQNGETKSLASQVDKPYTNGWMHGALKKHPAIGSAHLNNPKKTFEAAIIRDLIKPISICSQAPISRRRMGRVLPVGSNVVFSDMHIGQYHYGGILKEGSICWTICSKIYCPGQTLQRWTKVKREMSMHH